MYTANEVPVGLGAAEVPAVPWYQKLAENVTGAIQGAAPAATQAFSTYLQIRNQKQQRQLIGAGQIMPGTMVPGMVGQPVPAGYAPGGYPYPQQSGMSGTTMLILGLLGVGGLVLVVRAVRK